VSGEERVNSLQIHVFLGSFSHKLSRYSILLEAREIFFQNFFAHRIVLLREMATFLRTCCVFVRMLGKPGITAAAGFLAPELYGRLNCSNLLTQQFDAVCLGWQARPPQLPNVYFWVR